MPGLRLWFLGPPRAEIGDSPVALQRRKTIALLAYLAATGEAHLRDSLAAMFWPEADQSTARTALRRDLSALNAALGHAWLAVDRDSIRLKQTAAPPSDAEHVYWLDMDMYHDLLAGCRAHGHSPAAVCAACLGPLAEAVDLYRDRFLAGFTLRDSPDFDEWQFFQAETLRQEQASALERLVHASSAFGEGGRAQAIPYARRWLALDTLHEPAHRHLMQLYAGTGQQAAALRQYSECVRLLREELGVLPEEETVQLYEAIKAQKLLLPPSTESADGHPAGLLASAVSLQTAFQTPTAPAGDEEAAQTDARSPVFVAQEHELGQLDSYLERAIAAEGSGASGCAVFVVGEAGSGKTAIVQEFAQRALARRGDLIVVGGNCNAYTGLGDPYLPFREILGGLTGDLAATWTAQVVRRSGADRLHAFAPYAIEALVQRGPDLVDTFVPGSALARRAAASVVASKSAELVQLQALVARHASGSGPTGLKQTDLFDQYVKVLHEPARRQPLLVVLDDLQWADAGSISLLFHLGRRLGGSRILVVGIYRPSEVALGRPATLQHADDKIGGLERERHPLVSLIHEFQVQFGEIQVDLGRAAGRHFVDLFVDSEPNRLGPTFREALFRHTSGHALFTVEMLRGMQERGDIVKDDQGRWTEGPALNWVVLPARIEGVIGERIGRLPAPLRELLKVASVEGEIFTAEVVSRVQMIDDRLMVRYLSGELDSIHQLVQNQSSRRLTPGGQQVSQYRFRHILFQKYLYGSLDEAECAYLHEAVGQVLEHHYGQQVGEIASELARHFEYAGWPAKAARYLQQAGDRAVRLSANEEALVHLTKALSLLETLPDTPEANRQELALQISLFAPLSAVKGYGSPEVGRAYGRALELCHRVDDARSLFQVTYGLWGHNLVRAQFRLSRELAQECLTQAESLQDTALLLESNRMTGEVAYHRGELARAIEFLERSRTLYDPLLHRSHAELYGQDPGVALQAHGSWALWHLGYADQALAWAENALALAESGSHLFSTVFALEYASILHQFRGELQTSKERAEAARVIATEQGFVEWLAMVNFSLGWVLVERGEVDKGIAQMRQALTDYRATGSEMFSSYFLTLLPRAYAKSGHYEAALAALDEALVRVEKTEGRVWEAEFHRLRGKLLCEGGRPEDEGRVEMSFLAAMAISRQSLSRALELRAASGLARLWQRQGKVQEARQMLESAYGWFTEGFDTADLQAARALLRRLAA